MKPYLIALLLITQLCAKAQEPVINKATPAETMALKKAVPVIETLLSFFDGSDWIKTNDYYNGEITVNLNPAVPIDINCNFERTYRAADNSERTDSLIKPLADKIIQLTREGKYDEVEKLNQQIKTLGKLTVDVYINRENTYIGATGNQSTKLGVKGVSLCYKTQRDQFNNRADSYWLLFGNWKTATIKQYGLTFHFLHLPKTPYVENIAIVISGADDCIQQLLKTIDWGQLQNALTL